MVSGIDVSLSGLAAASKRLEVGAQNLANSQSTKSTLNGVQTDGPYLPQDVVQISDETGAVTAQTRTASNPTYKRFEPQNPDASSDGTVSYPNVDEASELVNIQVAANDYKANLKALQAQNNTEKFLLDIFS